MPANTVYVGRPTKWGNPHSFGGIIHWKSMDTLEGLRHVVNLYRIHVEDRHAEIKKELRGKNLACWCSLEQPCHADVLLEIANRD